MKDDVLARVTRPENTELYYAVHVVGAAECFAAAFNGAPIEAELENTPLYASASGTLILIQEEIVIPTVSEWGLVVMTLLLLTGIKITFGRRRAAQA